MTKSKVVLMVISALIMLSMVFVACGESAPTTTPTESITWRLQTVVPEGTIMYVARALPFAELVEQRSNGRLHIDVYPTGAIVEPLEVTSAVGKGVIEMGGGGPSYDAGILTEAIVAAGIPFAWATCSDQYEFWHEYKDGLAYETLNELYAANLNVRMLCMTPFDDAYGCITNFPVSKVADFEGKKIRAVGTMAMAMTEIGASTVRVSLPEVYMSLQTGTVDGACCGFSLLEDFNLKEVVKYVIIPPLSPGTGAATYVNLDEWNSLPADLRDIVDQASHDAFLNTMVPYALDLQEKTFAALPAAGVEVLTLSDEETGNLIQAMVPVWEYIDGLSPKTAELMNLLREFLDTKGTPYPGSS